MENLKITIKVGSDKSLANEVLDLFGELGFKPFRYNPRDSCPWVYISGNNEVMCCTFKADEDKEITIQELEDMVVLKRNDVADATHIDSNKYDWFVASDQKHYRFQGEIWVYQPYVDCLDLKPIQKEQKMKEFLDPSNNYEFIEWDGISCAPENWIEVPEGAEILTVSGDEHVFWKDGGGYSFHTKHSKYWDEANQEIANLSEYLSHYGNCVVWQREKESLNDKVASAEEFRKESIIDKLADLPEFKHDAVNHPGHYTNGDIECIDAIQASMSKEAFAGFLKGNIIKYMWRYEHKNGIEDLKKSQWYQNKLIELLG